MQIVIEMDDEEYQKIMDKEPLYPSDASACITAIRDGTPLPKGHGRLIDGDKLDKERIDYIVDGYADSPKDCVEFGMMIINAPTVIEAEEEGQE